MSIHTVPSGASFNDSDSALADKVVEQALFKAAEKVRANALLPREYRQWPVCVDTTQFSTVGCEKYLAAFKQAFADGYHIECKPTLENTYASSVMRICVKPK